MTLTFKYYRQVKELYQLAQFPNKALRGRLFILSSLLVALLELLGLAFIAAFITQYLSSESTISVLGITFATRSSAVLVLITFWFLRSLCLSGLYFYNNDFIQTVKSGLQLAQMNSAFRYNGRSIEKEAGTLFNALTNEVQIITGQILIPITSFLPEMLFASIFLLYAMYIYPVAITGAAVILCVGIFLSGLLISPASKKFGQLRLIKDNQWSGRVLNVYSNKQEAEVYGVSEALLSQLHAEIQQANKYSGYFLSLKPTNKALLEFFGVLSIIVLLIISSSAAISAPEGLLFLILTMLRMLPSFSRIMVAVQSYKFAAPVLEKQISYISKSHQTTPQSISAKVMSDSYIECNLGDNLSPTRFTLNLRAPSLYVIVGPSGIGKTLITTAIIDALIKNQATKRSPYQFSYSAQKNLIMPGNIVENINYYRKPTASRSSLGLQYLRDWGFTSGIFKPNLCCVNLSGGQQKRLSVARALADNAKIVILDEPTSGLDQHSAKSMIRSLKEVSKSSVILAVTHDQNLISEATSVIQIDRRNSF